MTDPDQIEEAARAALAWLEQHAPAWSATREIALLRAALNAQLPSLDPAWEEIAKKARKLGWQ